MAENDGIKKLLAAEDEAAAIVKRARDARASRLQQSDVEASEEIAAYRRDLQSQMRMNSHGSESTEEYARELDAQTNQQVTEIRAQSEANTPGVTQMLLHKVTTVHLRLSDAQKQSIRKIYGH